MFTLFGIGVLVVVAMSVFVLGLVFGEMGRGFIREKRRQLLLVGCLLSGIVAFGFKLIVMMILDSGQGQGLSQALVKERNFLNQLHAPLRTDIQPISLISSDSKPYVWETLPTDSSSSTEHQTQWVELGRRLFHDTRLSLNHQVSCASCHNVFEQAGTDLQKTSIGIYGQRGARNAPTVWNSAFQKVLFWDGRAKSLEEQAKGPPVNPLEMGLPNHDVMVERVQSDAEYVQAFRQVLGADAVLSLSDIVHAIAMYERTLVARDTAYDRFVSGNVGALSAQQQMGMRTFGQIGCIACHSGANFSASSVFSETIPFRVFPASHAEVAQRYGLMEKAADGQLRPRAWRVPSLRNVALTAPYFHNGQVSQLQNAIKIMAQTQLGRVYVGRAGHGVALNDSRSISAEDIENIAAFLKSLSSDRLSASHRYSASSQSKTPL